MQKRKELYIKNNHNKTEYAKLNKLVTKKREDIWNHNMLTIYQTVEQGIGFKSEKKEAHHWKNAIKEEEGSVTWNRDCIVQRAKEFYEELYFNDSVIEDEEFNELSTTYTTLPVLEISPDEVEYTIHQLKQEKAPGPNNTWHAGPPILEPLANSFTECLKQNKILKS